MAACSARGFCQAIDRPCHCRLSPIAYRLIYRLSPIAYRLIYRLSPIAYRLIHDGMGAADRDKIGPRRDVVGAILVDHAIAIKEDGRLHRLAFSFYGACGWRLAFGVRRSA
jgi:hypothetical protein